MQNGTLLKTLTRQERHLLFEEAKYNDRTCTSAPVHEYKGIRAGAVFVVRSFCAF